MKTTINWESGLRMTASTPEGLKTEFDAFQEGGPPKSAPSPVEHVLAAIAACSAVDVLSIIKKRRKTITGLTIEAEGTRRDELPRILTHVTLRYIMTSPDATPAELERAVNLSMETYCSVSAMVGAAGCEFEWETHVRRPEP